MTMDVHCTLFEHTLLDENEEEGAVSAEAEKQGLGYLDAQFSMLHSLVGGRARSAEAFRAESCIGCISQIAPCGQLVVALLSSSLFRACFWQPYRLHALLQVSSSLAL